MTRINARIPPELSEKLTELQRRTGKSVTGVLRAALEGYYEATHPTDEPAKLLVDFIGCSGGPRALSTNYKKELTRSLDRKGH